MPDKNLAYAWALRPLRADELELLYDITRAAIGPYVVQVYGEWNEAVQRRNCAQSFAELQHAAICVGSEVVGVLAVQEFADAHYLRTIYLQPQVQQRGFGTRVISHVIARADVRGLPLKLRVLHINPARQLYERLGFKTTEIVDDIRRVMMRAPTAG